MSFSAHLVSFLQGGTTGAPATQNLTGVPFAPKVAIFFGNVQATTGFANGNYASFHGAASLAGVQRSLAAFGQNTAPSAGGGVSVSIYMNADPLGGLTKSLLMAKGYELQGIAGRGRITFTSDGCSIAWTDNDPPYFGPSHVIVNEDPANTHTVVLFLGGDGLETTIVPWISSLTDEIVTGYGFQPNGVLQLVANNANGLLTFIGTGGMFGTGWFSANGHQGANYISNEGLIAPKRLQRSNYCTLMGGASVNNANKFSSMDVDGFTLLRSLAGIANSARVAIGFGGDCFADCGFLLQPNAIGIQQIITEVANPKVLFITSVGLEQSVATVSIGSPEDGIQYAFGITDGTTQISTWVGTLEASDPTISTGYYSETDLVIAATPTGGGGVATLNSRAEFDSFISHGFNLDWTTVDSTPREFLWFVLGEEVIGDALSGIYQLVPNQLYDKVYTNFSPLTTQKRKIP